MFQILFVVFSLCLDSFVVSFAYGANNYKISFFKKCVISCISSFILLSSILLCNTLQAFFPHNIAAWLCIITLLFLGVIQLIKALLKSYLTSLPKNTKQLSFQFLGVDFNLHLKIPQKEKEGCTSPSALSLKETFGLGIALSLDNIAVGISLGLISISYFKVLIISLYINLLLLILSNLLGYKLARKINLDLGWLSGIILILLAVTKLT